jgi:hypothetical protein
MNKLYAIVGAVGVCAIFVACDGGGTSGGGAGGSAGSGTGGSATGGSGGSSGSATGGSGGGSSVTISPENMIDDMEAGTGSIIMQEGRVGAWYTYNDESAGGTQTPVAGEPFLPEAIPGGNGTSLYAAHMVGSGFGVWGAGMGFDLNNPGDGEGGAGIKGQYDGSAFQGIAFWAKGSVPMRFKVQLAGTVPTTAGGTCTGDPDLECQDSHGKSIPLSENWQQYVIPFTDLKQEGWGTKVGWDATTLVGIQFQVAKSLDFDVWIDDIGFY